MNKTIKMASLFSLALGFLLMGAVSQAQVPQLINYQGVLKDSGGNPITGSEDIAFSIYDAASGGNLLWQESHGGVDVENGLFNVLLGSTTFPDNFFSRSDLYLGVKVGTDAEMTPRQQLASVSDALKAADADTLGDGTVFVDTATNFTVMNTRAATVNGTLSSQPRFFIQPTDIGDKGGMLMKTTGGNTQLVLTSYNSSLNQWYELFHADVTNKTFKMGGNKIFVKENGDMQVQGSVLATAFNVNSSRALKKDITPLDQKDYTTILHELDNLQMVRYLYKTEHDRPPHLGVIAEDSPQDILDPSGKRLSVADYTGFVMAGLKAQMQEMKAQAQEMKAQMQEIKALKDKLNKFEAELAAKTVPQGNNIAVSYLGESNRP